MHLDSYIRETLLSMYTTYKAIYYKYVQFNRLVGKKTRVFSHSRGITSFRTFATSDRTLSPSASTNHRSHTALILLRNGNARTRFVKVINGFNADHDLRTCENFRSLSFAPFSLCPENHHRIQRTSVSIGTTFPRVPNGSRLLISTQF